MQKENIVTPHLVELFINPQTIRELDEHLLFNNDLGIHVNPTRENEEALDFTAKLKDFSPLPTLTIMKGYPSISVWDLKRRALAYSWFKNHPLHHTQDLYEAWYLLKFLCQEIKNPVARVLGKSMAELPIETSISVLENYRKEILEILEKPSAPNRIRNSLWKNYTHQVKKSNKLMDGIKDPNDLKSLETLIYELTVLEDEAITEKIFFGTSPIIYKSSK